MQRKISSAIEGAEANHQTQLQLRSGLVHLEPTPSKGYHPVPSVTKTARSRIPPPQVERIKQRFILGESQRAIARQEGRSRPAIARIVKSEEMQAFVQEMRERFYGLAPDALAAIEYALREQRDAQIGYAILRDIGVAPRKGETLPQPPLTLNDRTARQERFIAAVIAQRRKLFDIELPDELQDAYNQGAVDEGESAEPVSEANPKVAITDQHPADEQ
jgi:hypothetical protein